MNTKLRYFLGATMSVPLLPVLYMQGKSLRRSITKLPEATGPKGFVNIYAPETIRVLTLGESTVAGVGVENHKEGFTGLLATRLAELLGTNVRWRVYAKSGFTAKNVCEVLINKIEEKDVDLIVVGLGGNDAFSLNRPWSWAKNLKQLIISLQKKFPETPIAFLNMPPIKEFPAFTRIMRFIMGNLVEIHGQELSKLARNFENVTYNSQILEIEEWKAKLGNHTKRSDFFSDGVHPSKLTYQAWGRDFAEFVVREKVLS